MKKSILQRIAAAESRPESTAATDPTDKPALTRRHSSPVISNVGRALTQLTEDSVMSLDPDRIERSPYRDRFENDEEAAKELDALKSSIASEGQKIPVLVRPHPTKPDHYQLAYGYRRWAAIKAIMAESNRPEAVKIRAYVRELSDRELIEEQSLENGVRENLTWIEQAMWAVQLKSAGLSHRSMCPILGASEAAISHLFRVADAIPEDIILAIGRAKGVGRPKWTTFAELVKENDGAARVRKIIQTSDFRKADSSTRIALAMRAAKDDLGEETRERSEDALEFAAGDRIFGRMKTTASGAIITIPKQEQAFAHWLAARMSELVQEYARQNDLDH